MKKNTWHKNSLIIFAWKAGWNIVCDLKRFQVVTGVLWNVGSGQSLCVVTAASEDLGDLWLQKQNFSFHFFQRHGQPAHGQIYKNDQLIVEMDMVHCVEIDSVYLGLSTKTASGSR